jgi:coatomer protein complex subunit gamma
MLTWLTLYCIGAKTAELIEPLGSSSPSVTNKTAGTTASPGLGGKGRAVDRQQLYAEQLEKIQEFASYGPLLHSTKPVPLTESETEYVVSCVRHVFAEHIVFQFDCTNTINDQLLENVYVQMEALEISDEDALEADAVVPAPALKFDEPGVTYASFRRLDTSVYPSGKLNMIGMIHDGPRAIFSPVLQSTYI